MPQLQPWDSAARSNIEDNVNSLVGGNDVIHVINGKEANPWPWQVSIQVVLQVLKTKSFSIFQSKMFFNVFINGSTSNLLSYHNGCGLHSLFNHVLMKFFIFEPEFQR